MHQHIGGQANRGGATETDSASTAGINSPRLYDLILFGLTRGREQAYRSDLLERCGIASGHRVLDVGCGTGTQAIAAHCLVQPDGAVAGIDVSPRMVAAARRKARRAGADILFDCADATALPFTDDTFDVVTVTTVMHMVPQKDRPQALGEAARVLKRGGRLSVIDYAGPPESRQNWVARHGPHGSFDLHELITPIREAGIEAGDPVPLDWLDLHVLSGTKR